ANITEPLFSALPSSFSATSYSACPSCCRPTLIAMLIVGWFWLGASERGAFGFSNEKSLMYRPSTLRAGAPGSGCGCGAFGPPLVVVIYATLLPAGTVAGGGVANTGARVRQGSRKSVLGPALACGLGCSFAIARVLDRVGDLVPLARGEVDHGRLARG